MLYDPKWEVQTKPDVFSLESLITWLEKQPAKATYCYLDNGGCMLHQYFAAAGVDAPWVGGINYKDSANKSHTLSYEFVKISFKDPHTFGAALDRARKALAAS